MAAAACPVCGHENSPAAIFCARCTSPVAVVALHELSDADRRRCLTALLEVLWDSSRSDAGSKGVIDENLWRAYLSAFWLRPETALVLYAEALAIRSLNLLADTPWLDLGCGDGIHAALYSGWRFDDVFDAFASLDLAAADMYNRFDEAEFSAAIERTGRRVDYGIDIKETAVARAHALGVFTDVRQADATALPLPDASVGVIFSNMLRDLGEPLPAALRECRRVLRADGTLLLSAMTPAYAESLYFVQEARLAEAECEPGRAAQLLKLDRGRSVFCQRQLSREQWERLLAGAGLRLHAVHPMVGGRVIQFWDVGLRPFVHALLKQRESWRKANVLREVKESLLGGLDYVLRPLLRGITDGTRCMQLLEVRRQ
jgi:SAM-dependent methyltransferase